MESLSPKSVGGTPADTKIGGAERRAHPRYALVMKGLAEHTKLVGSGQIEIIASNISRSGMLVHTDSGDMLSEHDLMEFTFTPLHDGELIRLKVRVMWIERDLSKQMGRVSCGCAFIDTPAVLVDRLLGPAAEAADLRGIEEPY